MIFIIVKINEKTLSKRNIIKKRILVESENFNFLVKNNKNNNNIYLAKIKIKFVILIFFNFFSQVSNLILLLNKVKLK